MCVHHNQTCANQFVWNKKKKLIVEAVSNVTAVRYPRTLVEICVLRHHAWFAKVSWGTVGRGLLPGLQGKGWHTMVVHAPRYWSRRSMRIGFGTRRGRLGAANSAHFCRVLSLDPRQSDDPRKSRSNSQVTTITNTFTLLQIRDKSFERISLVLISKKQIFTPKYVNISFLKLSTNKDWYRNMRQLLIIIKLIIIK